MNCIHCKEEGATHFNLYVWNRGTTLYAECNRCHVIAKTTAQEAITEEQYILLKTEELLQ